MAPLHATAVGITSINTLPEKHIATGPAQAAPLRRPLAVNHHHHHHHKHFMVAARTTSGNAAPAPPKQRPVFVSCARLPAACTQGHRQHRPDIPPATRPSRSPGTTKFHLQPSLMLPKVCTQAHPGLLPPTVSTWAHTQPHAQHQRPNGLFNWALFTGSPFWMSTSRYPAPFLPTEPSLPYRTFSNLSSSDVA